MTLERAGLNEMYGCIVSYFNHQVWQLTDFIRKTTLSPTNLIPSADTNIIRSVIGFPNLKQSHFFRFS